MANREESTSVRKLAYRYQRTIARSVHVRGIGYLTGASVNLHFHPASPGSGVQFLRTDLDGDAVIPACIGEVTASDRRTTLGRHPVQVGLVEHVLAALAGLRIDNCRVEIDAPEPPGMDGSAREFVELLLDAGIVLQAARRSVWRCPTPLLVSHKGTSLALYPGPADELKISYVLDYGPHSVIGRQAHTQVITPESFVTELAPCRTFVLESEVAELRRHGLGVRTTAADLLVFGKDGPIDNRLRFANEPARHKVLDLLGDLSLFGHDVRGHIVAYRSGHPLNAELVRKLADQVAESKRPFLLAA